MIEREMIEKFGLVISNIPLGRSVMYNIPIYQYKDTGIYIAACDTTGEPQVNGNILIFWLGEKYMYMTPKFMMDLPIDEFNKICGL
jgi:hypothetical protein